MSLPDEEEVVGVVVGGRARAYRLSAFKVIARHVVNDVVNRKAVTVTYCDRTDCVSAFTDDRDEPLPIGLAGLHDGLLLHVGSGRAPVTEKDVPYRSLPFERTTWGAWKKAHPTTGVYLGSGPPPGSPGAPAGDW